MNQTSKLNTQYIDDEGNQIFVGDTLRCKWGYDIIVMKDKNGLGYHGKLVCDEDHSCKNIPYSLNAGKGHVKILE